MSKGKETEESREKTMTNTTARGAKVNVKDIEFWGDGDTFKLISKASSKAEGWMKSTKAMQAGDSVVVQVTTQQRNPDGSYSVAEALTTVSRAMIATKTESEDGLQHEIIGVVMPKGHTVIGRYIIKN